MYNKVDTNMNFVEREKAVEAFWRENYIFNKSLEKNKKEGEDMYGPFDSVADLMEALNA